MRTKLQYWVDRETEWDWENDKYINKIIGKGFSLTVTGKIGNEKEIEELFDKIADFIEEETGLQFSRCPDEETYKGKYQYVDSINVEDSEEKEAVQDAYKNFKKQYKQTD